METSCIVVGGGPAGLTAAITAAKKGVMVTLVERNARPARKLMLTGKGRCNLTNKAELPELIENMTKNGRFLYTAFSKFMPGDVMNWFEEMGVPLKTERGRRVFPASDRAVDIVDAIVGEARRCGVRFRQGRAVSFLKDEGRVRGISLEDGEKLYANNVIVATGGKSYPVTGSTGDGYTLAEQAGHSVVPPVPSLVPLVVREGFVSNLVGLSLRNTGLLVLDKLKDRAVYKDFGGLMFTHFGVSGPVILSASAHLRDMSDGRYRLSLDLKPALTIERLDLRVQEDFLKYASKDYINALSDLLPKKLVPVMVKRSRIPPSLKVHQITREMRRRLVLLLKDFRMTVKEFRPIDEAVVTSGGVQVGEISPRDMRSKLIKGLLFAGEVLDVDAYTGGYNLQIAFSTGFLAGLAAAEPEEE
ncbi:MAG TPA: aminoacetone oxidase family FAD-binding enzyme [Ruminococcaceae bacterium]|nr:aminoacetone oxidase family FAD-binding enzyme [Oscillospiraceae bacterium]